MTNTKFVVVAGYFSKGRLEFIQAIGIFQDPRTAYGEAYLYLNKLAQDQNNENSGRVSPPASITPLMELEGSSGFGMYLDGGESDTEDFAYILFCEDKGDGHEESDI